MEALHLFFSHVCVFKTEHSLRICFVSVTDRTGEGTTATQRKLRVKLILSISNMLAGSESLSVVVLCARQSSCL